VVSVTLLSAWLLHEPLTLPRILGAATIVAGILCLAAAERETLAVAPGPAG
jgi:drug/metabolite transporter (DMT)-like permease